MTAETVDLPFLKINFLFLFTHIVLLVSGVQPGVHAVLNLPGLTWINLDILREDNQWRQQLKNRRDMPKNGTSPRFLTRLGPGTLLIKSQWGNRRTMRYFELGTKLGASLGSNQSSLRSASRLRRGKDSIYSSNSETFQTVIFGLSLIRFGNSGSSFSI